jgi:CRISPR/Cas system-associated exonuclease Cas4 (RecB family)
VVSVEPVYISAEYRRKFLEVRDDAIDVLLSNMEPPEVECRA